MLLPVGALRANTQALRIDPDDFAQAHTQRLIRRQQGRRRGVIQGPGKTLPATIEVILVHRLAQRPANRSYTDAARHCLHRRDNAALAVTVAQHIVDLQHQGGCRRQAKLPGHRGAIRAADPYTDQVTRPHANRPGVTKAVAGAGVEQLPLGQGIALDVPGGGYLIDTPGIKGFGTFDIEPEELTSYFRDIFHFSKQCKFSNCTHTHEPGCAVRRAVEDHYIAESRYQSYLSMLEDKNENKYREAF